VSACWTVQSAIATAAMPSAHSSHTTLRAAPRAELGGWLRAGELRSREDVVQGDIQQFPEVLLRLFSGENTGKLVLAV